MLYYYHFDALRVPRTECGDALGEGEGSSEDRRAFVSSEEAAVRRTV